MNDGLIPRRYAKALYKFALEKGKDGVLYELMGKIADSFTARPDLDAVMANPFVSADDKQRLLATAAGEKQPDPVLRRFISLLAENKRIGMARSIVLAYLDIYRKMHGIHRVTVTSATTLDPQTERRITEVIKKQLSGGSMEYSSRVDPNLIGGFTVNIDNDKLDASVANELKQMRLKLLSN